MKQPTPEEIANQVERIRLARRMHRFRSLEEAQKQFDEFARTPATFPRSSKALSVTLNDTDFSSR
jgi:hypothetical protein